MTLTDKARMAIEDAVFRAAEDGATEQEIKEEFLYAIEAANDDGILP